MGKPRPSATRHGLLSPGVIPAAACAGLWAVLVLADYLLQRGTGLHPTVCLFRRLTGLPCATCGSTRAVVALAHGDLFGAVALNPGVTLLLLAAPVVLVARLVGTREPRPPLTRVQRGLAWLGAGTALAANWAYVIWYGV